MTLSYAVSEPPEKRHHRLTHPSHLWSSDVANHVISGGFHRWLLSLPSKTLLGLCHAPDVQQDRLADI